MLDHALSCAECGDMVRRVNAAQVYCGTACRRAVRRRVGTAARRRTYALRACGWCGGSLAHRSQQSRFCNDKCRYARRYADNREVKIATVQRRSAMPDARMLASERRHRKRAVRRAAPTVPFTSVQLAERLSMFAGCWICGDIATTVDHVKPLSKGGSHMLANLRPACFTCNTRKHATWGGVAAAVEHGALIAATRLVAA